MSYNIVTRIKREINRKHAVVFQNGALGEYRIMDENKKEAVSRLLYELAIGKKSGEENGWLDIYEAETSLGINGENYAKG